MDDLVGPNSSAVVGAVCTIGQGLRQPGAGQPGWFGLWEELPSTTGEGTRWSEDTVYVVEQAAAAWLSRSQVDVRGAFRGVRRSS